MRRVAYLWDSATKLEVALVQLKDTIGAVGRSLASQDYNAWGWLTPLRSFRAAQLQGRGLISILDPKVAALSGYAYYAGA